MLKPKPYREVELQTPAVVLVQLVSQFVFGMVEAELETFKGLFSEALTSYPPAPPLETVKVPDALAGVWGSRSPKLIEIGDMVKENGIIE
jgi:hypothetical protein